jgi:hypothetical protein
MTTTVDAFDPSRSLLIRFRVIYHICQDNLSESLMLAYVIETSQFQDCPSRIATRTQPAFYPRHELSDRRVPDE